MNLFARVTAPAGAGGRAGHGAQPPQADETGTDAAERVGAIAYRTATGREPARAEQARLGTVAHYAFGVGMGVCYTILAAIDPGVRAGYGVPYGTAVWLIADETIVPALGLSRGPRRLPAPTHAFAFAAHCVYGAALEWAMRRSEPARR